MIALAAPVRLLSLAAVLLGLPAATSHASRADAALESVQSAQQTVAAGSSAALHAQANPAGRAAAAAEALEAARQRLEAAQLGQDRARYARAVRDLEAALRALRAGFAGANEEVRQIERAFRQDDVVLKKLLAALVATTRAAGLAESLVPPHPSGPLAAARAADLAPVARAAMDAQAAALQTRLDALAAARSLTQEGEDMLLAGLTEMREAQAALRDAVLPADQNEGPPSPENELAVIAARSDTLSELARALAGPAPAEPARPVEVALAAAGELAQDTAAHVTFSARDLPASAAGLPALELPVAGRVLRKFAEPDAGGSARPGLTLAAAPLSVVTAPVAGLVRYAGPFLDFNTVVVLAPQPGTVVLLAGVAEVAVEVGAHIAAGETIGFLGGRELNAQEFLMLPTQGNDALGEETLYMELWRAGEPVDPGPLLNSWLAAQNG